MFSSSRKSQRNEKETRDGCLSVLFFREEIQVWAPPHLVFTPWICSVIDPDRSGESEVKIALTGSEDESDRKSSRENCACSNSAHHVLHTWHCQTSALLQLCCLILVGRTLICNFPAESGRLHDVVTSDAAHGASG